MAYDKLFHVSYMQRHHTNLCDCESFFVKVICSKIDLTEKGAQEEDTQRHINDRWGDVDEPVWKERSYSQKNDVIDEVFSMLVHLRRH